MNDTAADAPSSTDADQPEAAEKEPTDDTAAATANEEVAKVETDVEPKPLIVPPEL